MAQGLTPVDINTDTFQSLVTKVNNAIDLVNTVIMTANSTAGVTTGNAYLTGTFGALVLGANTVRGGNATATGNLHLSGNVIVLNTIIANSGFTLANTAGLVTGFTYAATNNDPQILDSFDVTVYRTVKYVISAKDTINNDYQATEIMAIHNGSNTFMTEYAILSSNGAFVTFSSNTSGGNFNLIITPTPATSQYKVQKTLLAV